MDSDVEDDEEEEGEGSGSSDREDLENDEEAPAEAREDEDEDEEDEEEAAVARGDDTFLLEDADSVDEDAVPRQKIEIDNKVRPKTGQEITPPSSHLIFD